MNDYKSVKYRVKFCGAGEKQEKYASLLQKYYEIASPEKIKKIRKEIFNKKNNLKQRKEAYKKSEEIILGLEPIFKELVRERNRIFCEKEDKNYFYFTARKRGVPAEKLALFLRKVDKVAGDINKNLHWPKNFPKWYWSEFNLPDFLYFIREDYKYAIPDDIYCLTEDVFPEVKEIISRIEIRPVTDFYPRTKFLRETKSVLIEISTKPSLYNALTFVHELGHALAALKLADEGIAPGSKSHYWHEKEAESFKFKFEEQCLPEEVKNASRGERLGNFQKTLFEYEIYNNPEQDYDKVYAKVVNRCYPDKANQQSNPFYVLEDSLIRKPGDPTNSVVWTELLS